MAARGRAVVETGRAATGGLRRADRTAQLEKIADPCGRGVLTVAEFIVEKARILADHQG